MATERPEPAAVTVENEGPIPVEMVGARPAQITEREQVARGVAIEGDRATLSAEGVAAQRATERGLVSAGQRDISRIWESTQRIIALAVVLDALFVVTVLVLSPAILALIGRAADEAGKTAAVGGLLFLTAVSNLVIGFYFGRTNHTRVGGIGGDQAGSR